MLSSLITRKSLDLVFRNGRSINQLLRKTCAIKSTDRIQTRNYVKLPKTPELIYVPKVTRWLINKIRFKFLQKRWDPEFTEGAFIYGTTQAVCRITEIIRSGDVQELKGLVTSSARVKLINDIKNKLTEKQRNIIQLSPENIKMLIPTSVSLTHDKMNRKNCRIGMRVLALKWHPQKSGRLDLVLIALQTEFLRDYTVGVKPEWTVSAFDVLECTLLSEARIS